MMITDTQCMLLIRSQSLDMTNSDRSLTQTDGYGQKNVPSTNNHSRPLPNQHQQIQSVWNPISTAPTALCPLLHMWCIWVFAHSELLYNKMYQTI